MKTRAFLLGDGIVIVALVAMMVLITNAVSRIVLNYERQKEEVFKDIAYYESYYELVPCLIIEEDSADSY